MVAGGGGLHSASSASRQKTKTETRGRATQGTLMREAGIEQLKEAGSILTDEGSWC